MATKKKRSDAGRSVTYLLESGSLQDMRDAKRRTDDLLAYHWAFFSELEFQRNQVMDELKAALMRATTQQYKFEKWQRAVKWKYGLHPLSTVGSTKYVGQRFNFGSDINFSTTAFPALYLAEDKDTALQETLGQVDEGKSKLSSKELALMNPQSEVIVSVSGQLEAILDLRNKKVLKEFVKIISKFKISDNLKQLAVKVEEPIPELVKDEASLLHTLLEPDWRAYPTRFDVPANSQIFGHILESAGIEGVLYPSKLNGKLCLAIFTRNFADSDSFVSFDDDPPSDHIPRKFDSENYHLLHEEKISLP